MLSLDDEDSLVDTDELDTDTDSDDDDELTDTL